MRLSAGWKGYGMLFGGWEKREGRKRRGFTRSLGQDGCGVTCKASLRSMRQIYQMGFLLITTRRSSEFVSNLARNEKEKTTRFCIKAVYFSYTILKFNVVDLLELARKIYICICIC